MSSTKDIGRLVKHVSVYTVGNALSRGGAFILIPLYTKYLLPAEYGMLELFYALTSVVASFVSIGLAHATLRFYFEYDAKDDRNAVVSTAMLSSFAITVAGSMIVALGHAWISKYLFNGAEIGRLLYYVFGIVIFEMNLQVGLAYLRAREYSTIFVISSFVRMIGQVATNVVLVIVFNKGVEGILIGNLASVFLQWIIVTYLTVKECGFAYDSTKFKAIAQYSYPFLFSSVFSVIVANFDRFYLGALYSLASVGIYALALKFGLIVSVLLIEPFQRGYGAFRFSILKQDNANVIQAKVLTYTTAIIVFACLGVTLFAKEALILIGATTYLDAAGLVPIVMLSTAVGSLTYVFQTGILYQKKTTQMFRITVYSSIFNLLITIAGVKTLGMYGGAIGRLMGNAFTAMYTYMVSQGVYRINYDKKKVVLIVAAGIASYVVVHILSNIDMRFAIACKVMMLPLFVYAVFKGNVFDSMDIKYMKEMPFLLLNRLQGKVTPM